MKSLIAAILVLLSSSLVAQADITPQVTEALKKGDANALSAFFMSSVELEIKGEEGTYNAATAKSIMTKFFAENQVKGFTVKHQGNSKLDDQYRIGELNTAKGVFRLTFFMKKNANTWQIKQLKIES